MTLFLLAAMVPSLFWDGGPETADALRDAQIRRVLVPAALGEAWKSVSGIQVEVGDGTQRQKLIVPGVQYRMDVASATQAPWVDLNCWRFLRQPNAAFYYDVPGDAAALAAAEAFACGADALIHTDAAGLKPLGAMLAFLAGLSQDGAEKAELNKAATRKDTSINALANIGFVDDGSRESGELLNLLTRRNLLVRIVAHPEKHLNLTVQLGSSRYPKAEAADPSKLSQKIRADLGDEKRLVRVFGSEVVIVRLTGNGNRARLHLINYAAAKREVQGIRVRVAGRYSKSSVAAFGLPEATLIDYSLESRATEFTLPELKTYAVIDLAR